MYKYLLPICVIAAVGAAGCSKGSVSSTTSSPLESCFATASGHMKCVATPGGVTKDPQDVDGDGKPDTFVCANHPRSTGGSEGEDQVVSEKKSALTSDSKDTEKRQDGAAGPMKEEDDCAKLGCRDLRAQKTDQEDHESSLGEGGAGGEVERTAGGPGGQGGASEKADEGGDQEDSSKKRDDMECPSAGAGGAGGGGGGAGAAGGSTGTIS